MTFIYGFRPAIHSLRFGSDKLTEATVIPIRRIPNPAVVRQAEQDGLISPEKAAELRAAYEKQNPSGGSASP